MSIHVSASVPSPTPTSSGGGKLPSSPMTSVAMLQASAPAMSSRALPDTCGWSDGLPDQPDRAAMRARAQSALPKASDLPTVAPRPPRELSDHEQMLEATGHRQLAELAFAGARGAQVLLSQGVQRVKQALAKPTMGGLLHTMTVAQFVAKYEAEYEIWVSPAVDLQGRLPGNLLFFGEHHANQTLLQEHKKVVFDLFDAQGGARVLLETQRDDVCERRADELGVPRASCVRLEAGSPHLDAFKKLDEARHGVVAQAAARILDVTPGAQRDWPCQSYEACGDFVATWWPRVPDAHVRRIEPLIAKANALKKEGDAELLRVLPLRNRWMLREARHHVDPERFSMGFTGAQHIPGMQKLARKTPLITMTERALMQRTLQKMAAGKS